MTYVHTLASSLIVVLLALIAWIDNVSETAGLQRKADLADKGEPHQLSPQFSLVCACNQGEDFVFFSRVFVRRVA